jgi:uncharacterized protein
MNYKVVVQLTNCDDEVIRSLSSQMKNLLKALNGQVTIEILCHGATIPFVTNENNKWSEVLENLLLKAVAVSACENMLGTHPGSKEKLYPGIGTVPSAIAEIVIRQQQGWGYIKMG